MLDKKFAPIEFLRFPTFPAPFAGSGPGETWRWGDYLIFLQKDAPTIIEYLNRRKGVKDAPPSRMEYPLAALVFRLPADGAPKNPGAPIIALSLERANYAGADDIPPEILKTVADKDGKGPIMIGVFANGSHYNFGPYFGEVNRDAARAELFKRLKDLLDLTGEPEEIGSILDGVKLLREAAADDGSSGS